MHRRTRSLSSLVAFLGIALATGVAPADEGAGQIAGFVVDADTGKGIPGARVVLRPSGARAVAGAGGRFVLRSVAPGSYSITCAKPGYQQDVQRGIAMTAGAVKTVRCRLRSRARKPMNPTAGHGRSSDAKTRAPRPEPEAAAEARAPSRPMPKPRPTRRYRRAVSPSVSLGAVAPASRPAIIARPPVDRDVAHNTEGYDKIDENPFKSAQRDPLSTFSIDVDTASYSNVRRFIEQQHQLPPKDAVKIEELINYFSYDYKDPRGEHPFSVTTEVSVAPWNPSHRLVHIGLQGRKIPMKELPPSNLVFLLDVSGSMSSPNKLPLLKAAFKLLVNNMRARDRVAIVVYAGAAGLVLPSTPGTQRGTILDALDRLQAGGSTAGEAGIRLAYDVARQNFIRGGNNRVILATDGDFNVGPSSDGELVRLIEQKRKQGVFLTVLGFGMGNYKDGKMEKLADKGNGNHAYIDSILEARKVLVTEMGATLFTIAKDVKLQLEFNPSKVKAYRLIGYENRMLAAQDFNDDKKDAGELGAGHTVTALYEIIPAGSKEKIPGIDELKYQKTVATTAAGSNELLTVKLRYKRPNADKSKLLSLPLIDRSVPLTRTSNDFRFSAAVAEFGMLLRGSRFKGNASYGAVIERARRAMGKDTGGYRAEFLGLVRKASALGGAKIAN